jgi:uracil-DNA glycosylase family 4
MTRRDQMLGALEIGPQWTRRQSTGQGAAQPAEPRAAVADGHEDARSEVPEPAHSGFPLVGQPAAPQTVAARPVMKQPVNAQAGVVAHDDAAIAAMDWEALQSAVATCTRCHLCEARTRTVFGTGDPKAAWLFVGEGPGRTEDQQGEPFVGQAGKLLDNMLAAMSLRRGRDVFIANVVKCRPTDDVGKDRAPTPEEAAACLPYLQRQIALIQPRIVVALGKVAALTLLERDAGTALSSLRGTVHRYGPLPLVVTYHPAYLLRALADKRKAWQDLCLAMDTLAPDAAAG